MIKTTFALKGQNKTTMQNPCDALSGRRTFTTFHPGRCPGLTCFGAFSPRIMNDDHTVLIAARGFAMDRAGRPRHAVRSARTSDAPYQKSLIQPNLTKYFPGNCLTRRFSSSCKSVDETAALGRSLRAAISSIEVSVASIAS